MDSEQAAEAVAANRHKKFMLLPGPSGPRKRYIEVFQCSSADMSVVLANPELPTNLQLPAMNLSPHTPGFSGALPPVVNLTPPGLSAQTSPQQGSPPMMAGAPPPTQPPTAFLSQVQQLPQLYQQPQPRAQLVSHGKIGRCTGYILFNMVTFRYKTCTTSLVDRNDAI